MELLLQQPLPVLIGAGIGLLLLVVLLVYLGIRLAKWRTRRKVKPAGASMPLDEPEVYDLRIADMKDDVEFWKKIASEVGGPVLEVGTRTGRLAIELAKIGLIVTGLEPSRAMLQRARVKAEKLDPKTRLEWVEADPANFSLGGRTFRLIMIPAAALQDLPGLQEVEQCLRCVAAHLEPEGRLVLAVQAPRPELLKAERRHVKTLYSTRTKQPINYYFSQEVDYNWQRLKTVHEYEIWEDHPPRKIQTSVTGIYFTGPEMLLLLRAAGLEAEATYGSYSRERPGPKTEQFIFLARLPRVAPPAPEAKSSGKQAAEALPAPAADQTWPALPAAKPALVSAGSSAASSSSEAEREATSAPPLPSPSPSGGVLGKAAEPAPAQGLQSSALPPPRRRTAGRPRPPEQ
jgi:ubiquinone/menaquinone biosynthesis C-methylase UbiE